MTLIQYVSAENRSADLVSYDGDFENTTRGRRTPSEIVAELRPTSEEQRPQPEEQRPETEIAEHPADAQAPEESREE